MWCHVYWYSKIVKAAIELVTVGEPAIRDNRSDEGDSDEVKKPSKEGSEKAEPTHPEE